MMTTLFPSWIPLAYGHIYMALFIVAQRSTAVFIELRTGRSDRAPHYLSGRLGHAGAVRAPGRATMSVRVWG